MSTTPDQRVDCNELLCLLEESIDDEGNIPLDIYLAAFDGVHTMFVLLGKIFSYISNDVGNKIAALRKIRSSAKGKEYLTIQSMVEYETTNNLLKSKDSSGCRNLLSLHWTLEYVLSFLNKLKDLDNSDRTCPASQEAYKSTLGNHHSWIIHKAAMVAMLSLPNMEDLIHKVCIQSSDEARAILPRVIEVGKKVWQNTEKLYEDNKLLNLS